MSRTSLLSALAVTSLALALLFLILDRDAGLDVSAGAAPTATPTKQPFPGDTDGDGCTDQQENGLNEYAGGQRDFLNPWDYFNPSGDGFVRLDDILGVMEHFSLDGAPPYDVNYDIGVMIEPPHWNRAAPDGKIDLPNDILGVALQYHHDCARPPAPGPTPPASAGLAFSIGVDTDGDTCRTCSGDYEGVMCDECEGNGYTEDNLDEDDWRKPR